MIFMKVVLNYLILCFLFPVCAFSQEKGAWQPASTSEIVTAYQKMSDWFITTTSYSFHLKYTSYKNHISNEVIESSEGYYKRVGNNYKTEAIGIKTVQNAKVRIIIDTSDKIVTITNPGNLSPAGARTEEFAQLVEVAKALKKRTFGKGIAYRVDLKKNEMYDALEFIVSDKGIVEKLIYYYSERSEKDYLESDEDSKTDLKIKPRLEVEFTAYQSPTKFTENEFTEKSIVINDNRKVALLDRYRAYQVKDYRTAQNN